MAQSLFPPAIAKYRELSGMTQRQLSARIGASTSSLCRWESEKSTPKRDDVERLDEALGAGGKLLRAWTVQTSGSTLPPWMQNAGRLQEEAASIEYISPVLVPGLLQAPEYARIVFQEEQPFASPAEISRLAAVRCGRYEMLRKRNDPLVSAVFPQTAVTCFPSSVMKHQVEHLLRLLESGRVRIHLVPPGALLVGVTSPLLMVRLLDGDTAASSDHLSGNVIHDRDSGLDRLSELVKRAYAMALPSNQSRTALEELL